ncbi:hypothetical protein [Paenibacillus pini]|uniref:Uncharacterized protein n=1 Tax=Paenibacillus pini JCM 16418 TaxID=1236976 RepID=W7YT59_9BACL|nr:hypothetical protein [Paenibacillus pini]GAF10383.1 hypothetical protein JCM16418_4583 [Paenibacillus pini JCM 16418]
MDKLKEIKELHAAASTEHEWDTDGTFVAWKEGCPLKGTYRQIALTQSLTGEIFKNENNQNDAYFIAHAPEYITYLLQLVETQSKALAAIEEELVDSDFVGDQRIMRIIKKSTHI